MSVKNTSLAWGKTRLFVLFTSLCLGSGSLLAAEPNFLSSAIRDPLRTRPDLLEHGRPLPGDAAPSTCGVVPPVGMLQVSLSLAVDFALCNNPKVRAAWAGIKERSAGLGTAEAGFMPTILLSAGRERTQTSYPGSAVPTNAIKGNTVNGSVNWRLFDFGARDADRAVANSLLLGAIESHDATLQQVMSDTVQAYFDAQSAEAVLGAKDEDKKIAQATLASVSRRENSGAASHSETLQASTAFARAELDLNRAVGDYRKALSVLIYIMGLPTDRQIQLSPDGTTDLAVRLGSRSQLPNELDEWLREAGRRQPAILAADAQLQAARSGVKSARSAGLPSIDLSANYYRNGYPNQGLSPAGTREKNIGLFISIPIFSGFSHVYQIRQAEAIVEERQADFDDTRHNVLTVVVKAYADARSALESLDASSNLLAVAQASLASTQRRFDKGAAAIDEILNVQKALTDAKQERIRSVADWRSARLRLMAAAGLLGHTELTETGPPAMPSVQALGSQSGRE